MGRGGVEAGAVERDHLEGEGLSATDLLNVIHVRRVPRRGSLKDLKGGGLGIFDSGIKHSALSILPGFFKQPPGGGLGCFLREKFPEAQVLWSGFGHLGSPLQKRRGREEGITITGPWDYFREGVWNRKDGVQPLAAKKRLLAGTPASPPPPLLIESSYQRDLGEGREVPELENKAAG